MKKRLLSLALVLTMICSLFVAVPVSAASMFTDVNGHWAQATIEELASKGIVNGKGAGLYDPEGKVTRAEFSKLLMCIVENSFESVEGELVDVPKDAWFNPYVYAAFDRGLFYLNELNGNQFMPNSQADRETVAVWAVRLLGVEGESSVTPFVDSSAIENKVAVATAYNYGIVSGDGGTGKFRPDDPLTRAEAATIIKRVINKYQEIYSVRPSKNMIDYDDNIQEFEASENVNVLTSVDESTGKFVFTKINDEIRNLKKGDSFLIKPCDAIPTGVAIKVESITINGDTAEIYQGDIQLEDVIDEIDVAQEVEISMAHLVEGSLGEGVTIAYNDAIASGEGKFLADGGEGILMADGSILDPFKVSFNINQTLYTDSNNNSIKATGSFTMDNFKINCDISGKKIKDINIKLTETHREKYSLSVTGAKKYDTLAKGKIFDSGRYEKDSFNRGQYTDGYKKDRDALVDEVFQQWKDVDVKGLAKSLNQKAYKKDIKLASFNFPIGATGLYGTIDVRINFNFNGEVSATVSYSETKTNGIQYNPGSGVSKISERKDKTSDFTIAGKADAKLGASLRAGVTYLYILTLDTGIEGGLGATASTEILSASSEWNTGDDGDLVVQSSGKIIGFPSITATVEKDQCRVEEFHSCDLCIDGCLYLYLKLDTKCSFGIGKFSVTLFNPSYDIFSSKNAKIATGYVSFNFDSEEPVTSGWGMCPHNYKTPKIQEKSEDKEVKLGDDLTISVRAIEKGIAEAASGTGILTSNKTSAVAYQWYKDNIAIEGATSNVYQIPSVTETDFGTYKCIVAIQDMPSIYTISGEIKITELVEEKQEEVVEKVESTTVTKKGRVSENQNSSFTFMPSKSGTYLFENTTGSVVLININGQYKSNSGYYELVGGQAYTVNVEWGYEDTDYSINITGPITY